MTPRRSVIAAIALLAGSIMLAACSGASTGLPEATSAPTDAQGFTAEERQIVDAVSAYSKALTDYQKGDRDIDLRQVATEELATGITGGVKTSIDDKGLVMIGKTTITADSVTVTGETATYRGCNDASESFLVKKGQTSPGVGSTALTQSKITYGLVREDDVWLVADPQSEDTPC